MYGGKIINITQKGGGKMTVDFNNKVQTFKHTTLCVNGHRSDNKNVS